MLDTLTYPDVLFIFPDLHRHYRVNSWAWDRGWLPKDSQGHVEVYSGQKAEIWGGRLESGHHYLALKFV